MSPEPGTSRPPPVAALFNESSNATTTETELRRRGVKFPPRFGPIKTRRTVPGVKHQQITSSPPITTAATATSSMAVPSQEPNFLNGGGKDYVRNSAILNPTEVNEAELSVYVSSSPQSLTEVVTCYDTRLTLEVRFLRGTEKCRRLLCDELNHESRNSTLIRYIYSSTAKV